MASTAQYNKYVRLLAALKAMEQVVVAFSGGVDSALLLHAAQEALPDNVLAVTFALPYSPGDETARALALAGELGVRHRVVELPIPEIILDNPPDRCYLCKRTLLGELLTMAAQEGIEHVLDGSNVDDLDDYRPGFRAVQELGVKSPLLDAGLTKQDIRELSRTHGLSTWNTPAGACLLTRLPHGTRVEDSELARIDQGERFLRSLGFAAVRLRSHGSIARIEVPQDSLASLIETDRTAGIAASLRELGYRHVTLDLAGYRVGSLNEPTHNAGPKE